jgi:hypothetical protein
MIYSPIKKYGLALLAFFFLPFMAEASCGNITYIEYIDFNEYAEVSEPIEDCYNPFNTDASVGYSPILTLNDSEVDEGETVTLEENAQVSIEYAISPTGYGSFFMTDLYRKTESGYRQVSASFGGDYFLEGLPEGDYVAVYISETIFLIDNHPRTWTDKLKEFFLPKLAHAFYEDYQEVTTVSFTIEYRAAEPAGASSVLFLPGIQASRLYTDGVLGTENQL